MHSSQDTIRLALLIWIAAGLLALAFGVSGCGSAEGTEAPPPSSADEAGEDAELAAVAEALKSSDADERSASAATLPVAALTIAITAATAIDLSAQDGCEDVSGVWNVELALPSGHSAVTLTLEQTECTVTGTVVGRARTEIEDRAPGFPSLLAPAGSLQESGQGS